MNFEARSEFLFFDTLGTSGYCIFMWSKLKIHWSSYCHSRTYLRRLSAVQLGLLSRVHENMLISHGTAPKQQVKWTQNLSVANRFFKILWNSQILSNFKTWRRILKLFVGLMRATGCSSETAAQSHALSRGEDVRLRSVHQEVHSASAACQTSISTLWRQSIRLSVLRLP